jgi:hypothetical protein
MYTAARDNIPGKRRLFYVLWAAAAVLLAGAVAYHAKGFTLLFGDRGGDDFHQRWIELRYVAKGQNPYDVYYHVFNRGAKPWSDARDARLDPAIGHPDDGGYPPWAFASGWLFLWPSWPAALWYYAFLSLAAVAVVGCWATTLTPTGMGRVGQAFLFAGAVAVSACGTTLQVGQYGTIVAALIAASLWLLTARRGRLTDVLAGVLLGVAMLKPTIAGPFFLVFLVTRRWVAAAACVFYVAAAAAVVWSLTATSPVEMCLQMLASASDYVGDSQGLVAPLLRLGVAPRLVTPLLAAGVLLPAVALLWAFRRRGPAVLFAVAAVAARFWSYHKGYDDMMMVFLLAPLLAAWLRRPADVIAAAGALLVGASLWMPAGLTHTTPLLIAQLLCWPLGLCVLLFRCREEAPAAAGSPTQAPGAPQLLHA